MIDTAELALRLRRHVVRMCSRGGSSHVGSGLSIADIIAVLYGEVLQLDPQCPDWPGRDRACQERPEAVDEHARRAHLRRAHRR